MYESMGTILIQTTIDLIQISLGSGLPGKRISECCKARKFINIKQKRKGFSSAVGMFVWPAQRAGFDPGMNIHRCVVAYSAIQAP